jgi:hypothetical protein
MSISLSPSRYWPMVLPDRMVREACAMRLAGDAQRARLVLVDLQAQHLDGLVPVVVDAAHVRVARAGSLRRSAQARTCRVGADHAELHRVRHRRPVGQQLHAAAHLGELLGQQRRQALAQGLALGQVLGQHDGLATLACGKIWSSGR